MEYPIVETFFSIQGEGHYAGQLVNFIRLAGCPINCDFCDTDKTSKETLTEYALIRRMKKEFPVVITGGEPCIHDLGPLTRELHDVDFRIHLETSGAFPISGSFEYIAVSPKRTAHFTKQAADEAHEVKWLVPEWDVTEIQVLSRFFRQAQHFIQPVNDFLTLSRKNLNEAISVATIFKWPISIQMHKMIGVR